MEIKVTRLEKTTRINFLYDFYHSLLTPKQRSYMSLYYHDDFSLGEIAEHYGVSRQAVYDNLKRTEAMLENYEEKLLLFDKFQKRKEIFSLIKRCMAEAPCNEDNLAQYLNALEELN